MIPGALINFGGTEYTVPPINLRIDFACKDQIKTVCKPEAEVDFVDYVDAAAAILFALIQRNYPEMTRDQFLDMVDLPMLRPVMSGMLQISGYIARPLESAEMIPPNPSPEPASSDSSTAPQDGGQTTS
jgi:hypothetical protein